MSVAYGGPAAGNPVPTAGVNFGWITESWQLFTAQAGIWIVAVLALMAPSVLLVGILYGMM